MRVCKGYDPESKGKVESGVKYVKNNFFDITKTEQEFERAMKNLGMKFNVYLTPNKSFGKEAFLVIALKEKMDFISDNHVFISVNVNFSRTAGVAFS